MLLACSDGTAPTGEGPAEDVLLDAIGTFDSPDRSWEVADDLTQDLGDDPNRSEVGSDTDASDIGPDADVAVTQGVRTIGPSGGTIETDGARLIVPAGALARPVELRIEESATGLLPYPSGFDWSSPMIGFFPEGQAFDVPVTVAIRAGGSDSRMQIWWSPTTIAFWGPLETAYEGEWAFASVEHFSQGFVGRPEEAFCGDNVAEGGEECDGADLRGLDCVDFGLLGVAATCSEGCQVELSECIDPCDDVACVTPPSPSCLGNMSVRFVSPSECVGGTCVWAEETEDCASRACVAGACAATPSEGNLLVTEFLVTPEGDDAVYEWLEILNVSPRELYVGGMEITDNGSERLVLPEGVRMAPATRVVLAASSSAVPGVVALDWSTLGEFSLNSSDAIELRYDGLLIDRVEYDLSWSIRPGAAHSLTSRVTDTIGNDESAAWCSARDDYGVPSNLGSPGIPNPPCAVCGDGLVDPPEECDDGGWESGDGCDELCNVEIDLCERTVCDDPPPEVCESDTSLRQWVGICNPLTAECEYEAAPVSCASGRVCVFAECRDLIEVGEVVISEFMAVPIGGPSAEWFELTSFAAEEVDLSGVVVSGGSRSEGFTIPAGIVIRPSGTLVLAASSEAAGGLVSVNWNDSGSFGLSDASDAIELRFGGELIHRVVYDTDWPLFLSASVEREETKSPEEFETRNGWCLPSLLYDELGNSGSPRNPEHNCPVCGNSVVELSEECDDGGTASGDGCDAACQNELLPD